ncbi:MAG TPA: JAB domain-containing protein [Candidatus Saccharimonadales bacterium]|nr:JAB domain-containing protein [Candidatus Saccharimonadales bacterium]
MGSGRTNGHSYGGSNGGKCVFCEQPTVSKPLRSAKDILACLEFFRDKNQEWLVSLSLDGAGNLILRRIVTIGLLDMNLAHPREVFAGPLTDRAASIIIAHNHCSGICEPSSQDIQTTQQLAAAGVLLGIPLVEHLIVTKTGYFSFREQGLIDRAIHQANR